MEIFSACLRPNKAGAILVWLQIVVVFVLNTFYTLLNVFSPLMPFCAQIAKRNY